MIEFCSQLFVAIVIDSDRNAILLMIGKVLRPTITSTKSKVSATVLNFVKNEVEERSSSVIFVELHVVRS